MNWGHYQQSSFPHVESYHTTASLPSTPAQSFTYHWPTPSTQSGLTTTSTQGKEAGSIRGGRRRISQSFNIEAIGTGPYANQNIPAQAQHPTSKPGLSTPMSQSQRTIQPAIFHTPQAVSAAFPRPTPSPNPFTPPLSAEPFQHIDSQVFTPQPSDMTQRRMPSYEQRPLMGPPETPSRGMAPQSPNLFPNIAFSPDLFSQHSQHTAVPQTAPVYPQQRLFWDPAAPTPLQTTPQQFHTPQPFPDDFSASFNSNSTIMPPSFNTTPHDMPYDLPTTVSQSMSTTFMDGSVFPAPFQTSPRLAPPPIENPTQFLSSPARRFGGEPKQDSVTLRRPAPELPAYHHQLQESKREREMLARERRKPRTQKRPTDDDMVMRSVRRALSPTKTSRPTLTRSATFAGLLTGARRSFSTLDNISVGSSISSVSTRGGRSSPLRKVRNTTRRSSASATLRSRGSVNLEIDKNGVARTIMKSLPETQDEMLDDDDLTDELSSGDENDHHMLYSFGGDHYDSHDSVISNTDARDEIKTSAYLSMGTDRVARILREPSALDPRLGSYDPASTIRRVRGETLTGMAINTTDGNAQQALRALMQGRSRSASSHASSSSMQFHSSPPLQQGHLAGYNGSPTTITDPDLATPSTDVDSLGSRGATRCVCNSASPDGNIMIQCDSCSKWLHAKCVGLTNRNIPEIYLCTFCEQTPIRGGTIRGTIRQASFRQSPLAHKSHRAR